MSGLLDEGYFSTLIEDAKKKLRTRERKIHTLEGIPKFVFICGKQIIDEATGKPHEEEKMIEEKNRRYFLRKALSEYKRSVTGFSEDRNIVLPVLSEELYKEKSVVMTDLLTFENILCSLSDEVLLILESDGTKCELGAFASDQDLVKKLCVINNNDYEFKNSFISQGPIRKIKEISDQIIFVDYNDFDNFMANLVLQQYLKDIKEKNVVYKPNSSDEDLDVKNLIYELMAIFELFEPLTEREIVYLYKEFKGIRFYQMEKVYRSRFSTIESVLRFMEDIQLLDIKDNLYFISRKYKFLCVNTLFSFDEKSFNNLRDDFINLLKISLPDRLEVLAC